MEIYVLQSAFVIHQRPYRNTSLIVELFTEQAGRQAVIAQSARGPKSRFKGQVRPFVPLLVDWKGKDELGRLSHVEIAGAGHFLQGMALLSGLYLNELLIKLLQRGEASLMLFKKYAETLAHLACPAHMAAALRWFEMSLLEELGYGLTLTHEAKDGPAIEPDALYVYVPALGFVRARPGESALGYHGVTLLALHQQIESLDRAFLQTGCYQFQKISAMENATILGESRHLLKTLLGGQLEGRTIRTRELLRNFSA